MIVTSAQGPHLLLGRQHLHARRLEPRLEGELLQVHQRDAQRHRGHVAALGPQVHRRGQRRLRRRRLRAGAGLRRDRAGRRPLVVGLAARGAAARRAARHRRPDPRHRQAQGAPRPGRHLLHQRRRRARPARGRVAAGRCDRQAGAVRAAVQERAAQARRGRATGPPDAQGRRADAARARGRAPTRCATSTSTSQIDRARAPRRSPSRRRPARSRPTSPASRPPAPPGGRSRWRASSTTPSCNLRTNELDIGTWLLKTEGDAAAVLAATRRCWRTQDHWLVRETIGLLRRTLRAPRRLVAHAVRADRAGLVLRRHAGRARLRRRPRLHAGAARRRRERAPKLQLDEFNFGLLPDGQRPVAPGAPLLRRSRRRSTPRAAAHRHARSTPTPRSRSASSPPRPTTSTGTTRSASPSRSAPRCRPTR